MDIEKSRNGYYTITFFNKNNLEENEILKEFSSVGNVCKVIQNFQRVFIRYREKDEAERAIKKFGKLYEVDMARNKRLVRNYTLRKIAKNLGVQVSTSFNEKQPEGVSNGNKSSNNHTTPGLLSPKESSLTQSMEKLNSTSKVYHLVLGNLPKNYTIKDVRALVEEAKPVWINQLEETRVFNIRFCHIVLSAAENVKYLIDKLNGFVISGEKLVAAEAKYLLEWRGRAS